MMVAKLNQNKNNSRNFYTKLDLWYSEKPANKELYIWFRDTIDDNE